MDKINHNRLEEFRQLRKEVRHSEEYLIVGVDIAKDRHHAFFGTATGKTLLRRLVFSNDHEGFRKLLDQAEALRVRHGLKKVVYGKDAANVADLISQGKCLYYEYPSAELRGLRGLLSLKRRLKKQEHGYKVRIRNHLIAQYFPEMDRDYERLGAAGLSIVRWCFPASQITELDVEPFIQRVTSRRIRMETRRRLEEVWEKAGTSIGCERVPGMEHEAKVMVEGLRQIREVIKETEDKIQELCEQFPEYPYVLTIPGFGPDVSAKVLGAIGDPDRFQNGKQVLKMGGLDLSADRSGKDSDKAIPEISKRGKADLRYALYQAALIASVQNRDVMVYYTNKLRGREREKGIHIKMRVKLAAKLLLIAWTLMKKKEKFNPAYLNAE
jgi:transposase